MPFKAKTITLNTQNFPYMRIELPIPSIDPLEWLEAQTLYPKIYFETPKTGLKIAGIGEAFSIEEIPSFHCLGPSLRFFGGMDFSERKVNTWGNFPQIRYILPLIELEKREGISYLCFNRTAEDLPIESLQSLSFESPFFDPFSKKPHGRLDSPSFPVWDRNIREILTNISKRKLDKIVLARASLFNFEENLSPLAICKALQGKSPSATIFSYQFSKEQAFVGATPESLYQRKLKRIKTAAIAGTRPRGNTAKEDRALQDELLGNKKECYEFNVVKEEIKQRLRSLCTTLSSKSDNRIIQTSSVQHLYHPFEGVLQEGIDDKTLIHSLHPTPAVGGIPKEIALQEISKRETFDRGWYGAPVGWISKQSSHLLLAIRSALIHNNQLRLFSGAGIVPGSIPQREWEELEHKISQFILWQEML